VGHEVDFTIADFVADLRAPTPSGAAELVVPDQGEWQRMITATAARIAALSRRRVESTAQTLDWLNKRLAQCSPAAIVARQDAWLSNLRQVMVAAMRHSMTRRGGDIERIRSRLLQRSPALHVQASVARLAALNHRIVTAGRNQVQSRQIQLKVIARGLNSVSPLATLDRGYAIVTDSKTGRIVSDASKLKTGDSISARLATGSVDATVTDIRQESGHDD
jgi:exodeoxyribonuclease VII large subunit